MNGKRPDGVVSAEQLLELKNRMAAARDAHQRALGSETAARDGLTDLLKESWAGAEEEGQFHAVEKSRRDPAALIRMAVTRANDLRRDADARAVQLAKSVQRLETRYTGAR